MASFVPLEVVHKEMIDFARFNSLIYRMLRLNIMVMWISGQFCGILFRLNFGNL